MALTVFDSSQAWGNPDRGVQLFGRASAATGPIAKEAERLYGQRFPIYAKWMRGRTPMERRAAAQLRTYRFYRFVPTRVKILDERAFGSGVFVAAPVPRRPRKR